MNRSAAAWLFLSALFSGNLTSALAEDSEKVAPLFYFIKTKTGCKWQTYQIMEKLNQTFLSTPECPEPTKTVWDISDKRVIYQIDATIYSYSWKKKSKPAVLTEYMDTKSSSFWLGPNGHIRRAYISAEAGLSKENKTRAAALRPDSFLGEFAVAEELDDDNQWTTLQVARTRSECGDCPGLSVLRDVMANKPGSSSHADLLEKNLYSENDVLQRDAAASLGARKSALRAKYGLPAVKAEDLDDDIGYLPLDKDSGLLFKVTTGDTAHAIAPLFYCKDRCKIAEMLEAPEGKNSKQLGISVSADFALVTTEYDGAAPQIYAGGSHKNLFSEPLATGAIWLPGVLK